MKVSQAIEDKLAFPTSDCLEPHEWEEYFAGELTEVVEEHINGCGFCQAAKYVFGGVSACEGNQTSSKG